MENFNFYCCWGKNVDSFYLPYTRLSYGVGNDFGEKKKKLYPFCVFYFSFFSSSQKYFGVGCMMFH